MRCKQICRHDNETYVFFWLSQIPLNNINGEGNVTRTHRKSFETQIYRKLISMSDDLAILRLNQRQTSNIEVRSMGYNICLFLQFS